jgi:glycosyltransferase involved in cell wall biosynthesis
MRVTHVITRLIVGGAQENTIASVLGLRRKPDLRVGLIAGVTTGPEGSLEHQVASVPDLLTIIPELVRPVAPWRDWIAFRKLATEFRRTRPDIVHTHSGKAGILARLAARSARVPLVIHSVHGPSFGAFQGPLSNLLFRAAERLAGRCTTHFIVVAEAMARQYLAEGIGRTEQYTRIFSGFPLQPFVSAQNDLRLRAHLGIAENDFVIGKVARLFRLKGHDDLFAAAPAIVRACPQTKFLLVGGGEWMERFQKRAHEIGLQDRFVFTGLIPPAEIPAMIGIMDLLVHLSRREGLPRALPQALAAARPVVAYDCDGAREVCLKNETGFLIQPGDLSTLSARIIQLAQDRSLRERLGRRGQMLVKEWFSVEKLIEDQYRLYMKLARQHIPEKLAAGSMDE